MIVISTLENHGVIVCEKSIDNSKILIESLENIFVRKLDSFCLNCNSLKNLFTFKKNNATVLKEKILIDGIYFDLLVNSVDIIGDDIYLFPDQVVYLPCVKSIISLLLHASIGNQVLISESLFKEFLPKMHYSLVSYEYLCAVIFLILGVSSMKKVCSIQNISNSNVKKIDESTDEQYRRNMHKK